MKIQFDADLDYQKQALEAVTGVFKGQEICRTTLSVSPLKAWAEEDLYMGQEQNALGIGNRLNLPNKNILENINEIQIKNGLSESSSLESLDFTVEMETGTGKTYVYLRSIFELNRLYGLTKFIIVTPSIAVKEGVYKSLQITEEHFRELYENVSFDYFVYNSGRLSDVRNFATSSDIQIMVINIDAFRKSFTDPDKESRANIIHRAHDRMTGAKPIEYIQKANPIVIIDEPQSVDTTQKSREAIASLHPLCTFRYSATHLDKHHMLYKLDSIDAYQQKLVKQIEVAGIEVKDAHNEAYIKLLSVDNKKSPISAKIEIDCLRKGKIRRQTVTVSSGADLLEAKYSGRDLYDGYIVDDICCAQGEEYISFTSKPDILKMGQSIGEVNMDEYKRMQIRKTIEEHLDKELRLRPQGIKVLSLFFIDRVANYRSYDQEGNAQKGKLAKIFEEEYDRIIKNPRYKTLPKIKQGAAAVHNGYFAIDKKKDSSGAGKLKDTLGNTAADENAYNLIMRDKEKLLSFDSKLRFIFSHSALKEGWDNPNVFQICTLNETHSIVKKRQEIGRGLRIAVNQDGERVHGFEVNTLTVMANESYERFAEQLQKEIEQEEGIRFGVVDRHFFARIAISTEDGSHKYLGAELSNTLWEYLKTADYIDDTGKMQNALKEDLHTGNLSLPEEFQSYRPQIIVQLIKVSGNLNIKNYNSKKKVSLNKEVFLGPEFKQLWDRIKHQTTFRVDFNTKELIEKCAHEIKTNLQVGKSRFIYTKVKAEIDYGGVHVKDSRETASVYNDPRPPLPDLITHLQNETHLTRRTIVKIINKSGRLDAFKRNPQKFIEQAGEIIQRQKRLLVVDGIKYHKTGAFYTQELFKDNELFGYLKKNMVESHKSVFDHVIYDSGIEHQFVSEFERNGDVKLYTKLPSWFKIDTPLGSYNPDWAVLIEKEGIEKIYFVIETKGTVFSDAMRPIEKAKIDCGKEHFKALENDVKFGVLDDPKEFPSLYI